jgi:hypothetical protein
MSIAVAPKQTPGFFLQAVLSFAVSTCAVLGGIASSRSTVGRGRS